MHIRSRSEALKTSRKKRVQKERKRYVAWTIVWIFVIALVIAGLAWGSGDSHVVVQNIVVKGNDVVHSDDIESLVREHISGKYFYLFHKDNIALFPKSQIEQSLYSAFPHIYNVDIYRDSFTEVSIEISERQPDALWCSPVKEVIEGEEGNFKRECYFIDNTGFVFAKAPYFSGHVFFEWHIPNDGDEPIGSHLLDKKMFSELMAFKNSLTELGLKPIMIRAEEESQGDYILTMEDGVEIFFNEEQETSVLLDNLDSVLTALPENKEFEYIDLRFGNKVFYRAK